MVRRDFRWRPTSPESEVLVRADDFSIQFAAVGHPRVFIRLENTDDDADLKITDFCLLEEELPIATQALRHAMDEFGLNITGRRIRVTNISTSLSNAEVCEAYDSLKAKLTQVLAQLQLLIEHCHLDQSAGRHFDLILKVKECWNDSAERPNG
jgi:hypothetical protein